ncbi:glycogen debranching N-terminal domain-containing protein [Thermobifida halotolerans]|uniref:glycogen debranching N-terminal domain-containing protein n=1 Tax=Thermobifida halotolerans TaxID=483545 RepID=UPI000A52AEBB|nr:glycogen debranching N-terminal domain-containing protein [Thermobifida halotolerans]
MTVWNTDTGSAGVGAGAVTIVEGTSFAVSAADGGMLPDRPHGVFYDDIRIVSKWEFSVNGSAPEPLTAIVHDHPYRAVFLARARKRGGGAEATLLVERDRRVGTGMREDITLRNLGREPAACTVTLVVDADFADLFEVKAGEVRRNGQYVFHSEGTRTLIERWRRGSRRGVVVLADGATSVVHDHITFRVVVPARGRWSTTVQVRPVVDDQELRTRFPQDRPVEEAEPALRFQAWRSGSPVVFTDNETLQAVLRRSQQDLGALRISDPRYPERPVVAAGAPWFMALFGRDSLLTAYMALPVDQSLALGTLQTLADRQGTEENH